MKKEIIQPRTVYETRSSYSLAVRVKAKSFLFISGLLPLDAQGNMVGKGDVRAQAKQIFENMKAILEEAGGTLENIVKMNFYLNDMSKFGEVREVREQYFKGDYPAATAVYVVGRTALEVEAIEAL